MKKKKVARKSVWKRREAVKEDKKEGEKKKDTV